MVNLNLKITDELREKAISACGTFIEKVDGFTIAEKAYTLHNLVQSFKEEYGVDICKFFEVEIDANKGGKE